MTPQQRTEFVLTTINTARRAGFTREMFVSMTNQVWDALVGAEQTAAGAPEQVLRLNGTPANE